MACGSELLVLRKLSPGHFLNLAGFVLSRLEHVPRIREHVDRAAWRSTVGLADGQRIDQFSLNPLRALTDPFGYRHVNRRCAWALPVRLTFVALIEHLQ